MFDRDWADWNRIVMGIAVFFFLAAIAITAVHGFLFVLSFGIHRRFGWPPYLRDISERICRLEIWETSIRRSWWAIPLFMLIFVLWQWYCRGGAYVNRASHEEYQDFLTALWALPVIIGWRIIGQVIAEAVQSSLHVDEARCLKCTYMLRGLTGSVCPECGEQIVISSPIPYYLGRRLRFRCRKNSGLAWFSFIILFSTSPGWAPFVLSHVPPEAFGILPSRWTEARLNRESLCPIKLDSFCILRGNNGVIVYWAPHGKPLPSHTFWWYWSCPDGWNVRQPDRAVTLEIPVHGNAECPFPQGQFVVLWNKLQGNGWTEFYNVDCEAEVIPRESAPDALKKLAEAALVAPQQIHSIGNRAEKRDRSD
jgi:hypothetical protein